MSRRRGLSQFWDGLHRKGSEFLAGQILARIDYLEEALARLGQQIQDKMAPYEEEAALLKTIPGVQDRTAEVRGYVGAEPGATVRPALEEM